MKLPRWLRRRTPEVDEVRRARNELGDLLCEARRIADEISTTTGSEATQHG